MQIAEDVVPLDQYIAEMDANAPFHAALAGDPGVAFPCQLLQCKSAFDGTDHRAELDQHPIASGLDDAPAMLGDERVGGGAVFAQRLRGASLVLAHQSRIARDIGGEDCGEAAGLVHESSPAARRRPSLSISQSFGTRQRGFCR